MKIRHLNHCTDVFCKKFLGYESYADIDLFAMNGSGMYLMDFLKKEYFFKGKLLADFRVAKAIQEWFDSRIEREAFLTDCFELAQLLVHADVPKNIGVDLSLINFDLQAKIRYGGREFVRRFRKVNTGQILH